jgi:ATP-binding cassette subfamily C protein LapB
MNASPSDHSPFIWAMLRLAQMQGGSLDVLTLRAASELLDGPGAPLAILPKICSQLSLPKPKVRRHPDRVDLPLLCHTAEHGWGLITDRNAQGYWVFVTPLGPKELSDAQVAGHSALLRIVEPVQLGFGLSFLGAAKVDGSFVARVRQGLRQYKTILIEACLASGFIGVLSLATSLFSMQVYDRVIPVRSDYTLIILGLGVLITIGIELAMKLARSHLMDHIIVGLDQHFSRDIFQRLLQLRVDQMPPSVGSLSGQLRGYEQVRAFYTATTLFSLIDLPLALIFMLVIMLIASPWVAAVPLGFSILALALGLRGW